MSEQRDAADRIRALITDAKATPAPTYEQGLERDARIGGLEAALTAVLNADLAAIHRRVFSGPGEDGTVTP